MVNRTKNIVISLLSVVVVIGSVEYFKIWTKENYDTMHCYTRVNPVVDDSKVHKITVNGTISCDVKAQNLQINKKLTKLKAQQQDVTYSYCVNDDSSAEKVIDKVVAYYADQDNELGLSEYCTGSIVQLL
ncbi:hypothetical protein DASC09_050190 [Saccharomycopsis crataegensis]|uniref:Uncharacterized protein n=1 Tax=Saccharomycopsis crataegensis TaxID=43959 RepID=A0AAV5QT68_9ASCO|nr:hypothetical protein DASC09_050190 [Saccharomycopsis crataegensis]